MIDTIRVKNFTIFAEAEFEFVPGINVVVGENGVGKSHLLKLAYACASVSRAWEEGRRHDSPTANKSDLQRMLADKLRNVFRPDSLGRLARRGSGRRRADVAVSFIGNVSSLRFSFATNSKTEVKVAGSGPRRGLSANALFFPTKEVISMYPRFAALYRDYHIEIDETYYDLCLALDRPLLRGRRFDEVRTLISRLEEAIGGTTNNVSGRFVLSIPGEGNMEIPLVAEGLRKLATVAYLAANGTIMKSASLFWDEPETNLNPKLIVSLVDILTILVQQGVQVIIATHSLFLVRALSLKIRQAQVSSRFFALSQTTNGNFRVSSGDELEEIEPFAALDAEVELASAYDEEVEDLDDEF